MTPTQPQPPVSASRRVLACAAWVAVGALGVTLWRWLPGGFPWAHPRFVVNVLAPGALVAAALWGIVSAARGARDGVSASAVAGLLIGFAIAALIFFGRAGVFAAVAVGPIGSSFLVSARRVLVAKCFAAVGSLAVLFGIGAGSAWALRAPEATTRALGSAGGGGAAKEQSWIPATCGTLRLEVQPTLQFVQASRGRFWSIFADDDARAAISPSAVEVSDSDGVLRIDASRVLREPVYSHLNSFARVRIAGTTHLKLRFSSDSPAVEVLPADYPEGRPARFAAWTGEALEVFEATSAEKGPFRTLAKTALRRGDPLAIELLDGDAPQCRLRFEDFTVQASTALSPTAGFGIPQNAIEFQAADGADLQEIFISLAATSVGRGWDTVGHAAGTYRNRIVIQRDLR